MNIIITVLLPLGLVFIMFTLGVGLTRADFTRVLQRPLTFAIGAIHQIVLLPLVAFGLILVFGMSGELAIGVMILAACPGGVTSNVISRFAKADVALSVSLTAVISLLSVVTVPILLGLAFGTFLGADAPPIDITGTAIVMFALTVAPILLGLLARSLLPEPMTHAEPVLTRIAAILFAIIVIGALASNWDVFLDNVTVLGPLMVALLAILTLIGFLIPLALKRTLNEAKTISIETGVQNATLGIAVAALIVGSEAGFTAYSLPAATYGILMYLIIIPVLIWFRRIG